MAALLFVLFPTALSGLGQFGWDPGTGKPTLHYSLKISILAPLGVQQIPKDCWFQEPTLMGSKTILGL